jgi:hypothetical protein
MKRFVFAQLLTWAFIAFVMTALTPVVVHGQVPVEKPTTAVFDYAAYQTAQKYELGYFAYPVLNGTCNFTAAPGSAPTQTDDLGKPATTTGIGITAPLVARPIGCYGAKVRVLDVSGLYTDWSPMSNSFFTRPPAPSAPVVK